MTCAGVDPALYPQADWEKLSAAFGQKLELTATPSNIIDGVRMREPV